MTRAPAPSHLAAWRLIVLGAIILFAIGTNLWLRPGRGTASSLFLLALAGLAYLMSLSELQRARTGSRVALVVCLAFALAWRVLLVREPSGLHDDMHRYLWDARLQRAGLNPYIAIPEDPALAALHTPETRQINHPDLPSPYPPAAQFFFRAATVGGESARVIKISLLAADLLLMGVLARWLIVQGLSVWWVLAYAWNPVVALEAMGSGHIDVVGALLVATTALALTTGHRAIAAISLSLAISFKFLPVVLLPLLWRRVRWRDALVAAGIFSALYVPFLVDGQVVLGSVRTFVDRFRFNAPVFQVLETFGPPRRMAAVSLVAGLSVATWMRRQLSASAPAAWAWPMAAALLVGPVIYPWYLIWITPFLTTAATWPLAVWSVTILSTYVVWDRAAFGAIWAVPAGYLVFEYGAVVLAAALVIWIRLRRAQVSSSRP